MGTHERKSVCHCRSHTGDYQLSLLRLRRLVGFRSNSALIVRSAVIRLGGLPLLSLPSARALCERSLRMLPTVHVVDLGRGTTHGRCTVTNKTFSPSICTHFAMNSGFCGATFSTERLQSGVKGCVNVNVSFPLLDNFRHFAGREGLGLGLCHLGGRRRLRGRRLCARVRRALLSLHTNCARRRRMLRRLDTRALILGRSRQG